MGKEFKYLGVKILADNTFTISYANNKRKFYAMCAAILQKSVISKSAFMIFLSHCAMSILVYDVIAAKINLALLRELNVMVYLVIRRVFNIPKFVSFRNLYIQYNMHPVTIVILRRLLSIIASLCLTNHIYKNFVVN